MEFKTELVARKKAAMSGLATKFNSVPAFIVVPRYFYSSTKSIGESFKVRGKTLNELRFPNTITFDL